MSNKRENYFYRQLVPFFIGAYPDIHYGDAKKLGNCAFGYFRVLLAVDNLIDSKEDAPVNPKVLFEIISLHEQVIKHLCGLIDARPIERATLFWSHFEHLKSNYSHAVIYEKKLSETKEDITEESFEELAFGKSAICCAILYGLQALCTTNIAIEALNSILRHIHIAFQYLDDVSDFKKDIDENQWTYPQVLLRSYLLQQSMNVEEAATQHKYLFLSGIAQDNVRKAIKHYEKAAELADDLGLIDLKTYLLKEHESARFYLNEVNFLIEKTKQKSLKSQKTKPIVDSLKTVLEEGVHYLVNNAKEGFWTDFMTSAGRGKTWISGYVGVQLASCEIDGTLLMKVLENLSDEGAYNEQMLQDADSTTFLVGLHQAVNGFVPPYLIKNWLKFQNNDGSWSTYRNEDELRKALDIDAEISVEGWLTAHHCVSAAAALVAADIPDLGAVYRKTIEYLQLDLEKNHAIGSYWWTSDIYAQAFALMALCKGETKPKVKTKLLKCIGSQQAEGGFWVNPLDNTPNAFYTAIALKALMVSGNEELQSEKKKAVDWLLSNQMADGSWQTNRILRIPATNVLNPRVVKNWRYSSFGVNALSDDYNRVFTTETVVNALSTYQKMI